MSIAPEVSVVMANRNGARHLSAAIRSLQKQTLSSWELLFVDDGSQDESVALAQALAREDPRIRVFAQDRNRGPAAARNHALGWVSGRWVAIFDSDDLMLPDRLGTLHEHARVAGARILADNLLLFSDAQPTGRPWLDSRLAPRPRWIGLAEFVDSNRLYSRMPDLGYLKPFVSAELLRESGLRYDEALQIGEDYDLMARLLARGERLRFIPAPLYLYRRHAQSTSWRLSGAQIRALIESHDRFVAGTRLWNGGELRALARRRRSLQSMLLYDSVIAMLKAGEYGRAFAESIAAPQIWPLLTRPLRARFARVCRSGRHRQAVLGDVQASGA
ncbi:MAG TPA: glycosyltransferase family 2 protein [Rhizomicrobium sp.]|jgi:succinoglycan biosynthesis protein ExoO